MIYSQISRVVCKDDIITAMNEATNIDVVNQYHQISIKYFRIEFDDFNIDGINKYLEYKYD